MERDIRRDQSSAARLQALDARVTKVERKSSGVLYAFVSGALLVVLGQGARWGIEAWSERRHRRQRSLRVIQTLEDELGVLDDAVESNLELLTTELGEIARSGTSIGRGATAPLLPLEVRSLVLLITDDPPEVIRQQPQLLSDLVSLQTVAAYANSLGAVRDVELAVPKRLDDVRVKRVDEQLRDQFGLVRDKVATLKRHLASPPSTRTLARGQ